MAAFVPGFENDLFLSYAHEDDPRWVQAFADELRDEVSRRLGLGIAVWQDTGKLRAGENWQASIQTGIERTAAFVALVSPHYQNSQWCARERNAFRRLFTAQPFETSGRFFKAVKTPWPDDRHRLFLQAIQEVEFFKDDDEDGICEFTPGSRDFKRAVRKLADGIEPLLGRMRRGNQRVHVAWPVEECLTAWEQVSDELRSRGFDAQPTGPRDASFADKLLLEDMDHAVVSLHLLGSVHDPFAEHLALLAADLGHQMIFWIAGGAEHTGDAKPKLLLEAIRLGVRPDDRTREWPAGWSRIADKGIRSFIDDVITKLRPAPVAAAVTARASGPSIYIVHDPTTADDARVAMELKDQIGRNEKMNVFVSRADLPSGLSHKNLLKSVDGVLLYRNAAPEGWWEQLAPEVIFAERLFEREPIKSRAFLLPKPPPSWEVGPDVKVIPYSSPFPLANLEPFLAPLRAAAR